MGTEYMEYIQKWIKNDTEMYPEFRNVFRAEILGLV